MEVALKYIMSINDTLEKAKIDLIDYTDQLSHLDIESQRILHEIENETFNVVQGYQFAKQLKDIRTRRRIVKNNQELLQMLIDRLDFIEVQKTYSKIVSKISKQQKVMCNARAITPNDVLDVIDQNQAM